MGKSEAPFNNIKNIEPDETYNQRIDRLKRVFTKKIQKNSTEDFKHKAVSEELNYRSKFMYNMYPNLYISHPEMVGC